MGKNPLTFRMYADVKFNRKINNEKDFISPGGYEFKTGGSRLFHLDFEEYSCSIDKDQPSILHIECKNPDYTQFEDLLKITKEDLQRVIEIPEFFVFTGEKGETNLKPTKLLALTFCLPYENWENIGVPTSVCKKATVCCAF